LAWWHQSSSSTCRASGGCTRVCHILR
jgi:hypothetical protein